MIIKFPFQFHPNHWTGLISVIYGNPGQHDAGAANRRW